MKVIFAILILGLCGSIYANQAVFQELAQIQEHPFGATVLAAVSANLRAKTPIDEISDLLQKILDDLLADQQSLETYHTNTGASIRDTIQANTATRDGFASTKAGLENSIDTNTRTRSDKQATLVQVGNDITTTQGRINSLDADYSVTLPRFDGDLDDLTKAIEACKQALAKMATYQSATATSLLQVASSATKALKSFSTEMESMKSKLSKHGSMYSPLIHELIALTANPETDKASRIVDLLNQLLLLLQQAQANVSGERSTYVNNYNTQRGIAVNELNGLTAQQSQLTSDIGDLTTKINNAQDQLTAVTELLNAAQRTLDDNIAALNDLEAYYAVEKPK